MKFNLKLLSQQVEETLARSANTPARLTPKRLTVLLFFFPIFTILKLSSWLGFAWDDIFYKDYQNQKLAQPVFLIGNPRSGTFSLPPPSASGSYYGFSRRSTTNTAGKSRSGSLTRRKRPGFPTQSTPWA
jgi:hypothetical protein